MQSLTYAAMERPHKYIPLPNDSTIRILTLGPGQHGDRLTGTLDPIPIDSAGSYEAVSYVWQDPGPPNTDYDILIHGNAKQGQILALEGGSIYAALHRLRFPDRPRRIWADQCCINQHDPLERSQQVQLMNRIYGGAARILVYLGLDLKKEAGLAFALVHELDETLDCIQKGNSQDTDISILEDHVKENRATLQALTDRTWFKRGWIVQEIGTRTPATLFWGDASMDWDKLASVCERLKSHHRLRSSLGISTSDVSFLYRRFIEPNETTHHANRFNFVYELQRARHLRFTDDRDRLFAFLGHYSVRSLHPLGCGPVEIAADYTKTVEQTYIDVAVRLLRTNPGAACILLASVQHAAGRLPSHGTAEGMSSNWSEQRLPSWVPDWRWSEGIILAEPICPHRAQGGSTTKIEIVEGRKPLLRVHGVQIDTIDACSRPLLSSDFYETLPDRKFMIERLWHEICAKKAFDLDDKYPNDQTAFFAFMQTLSNGCVQAAGHECRQYDESQDREWLTKAARYIVETLGTSGDVSGEIRKLAESKNRESHREKWSRWATSASDGRIFARTLTGYYVLGPSALEAGDVVCVLFGSKVPFCLRPMGSYYLLVGECYVHGLMKGEAMDMLSEGTLQERGFHIV